MKKLKLNNEIFADEEKFVSTMTLLQASTGGGKSWAIRRILEQSFGKVPQIVIDTEGEFSTLREKHDYILIGKDYDIAADPKTAAMMALRLWEEGVSAIIDIYELTPWDRQLFVKNFVDSMINAPKKLWNPVLLVIDEAHEYAPEGDRTESGRAMHLLASKGRKRGIGVIFATQRISTLSKNVVAGCKNKLIGYTSLDTDMKRANAELGFTQKDQAHLLRKLDPGEFYAFGPAISREIIKFKIGDVATTHGNHTGKSAKIAPASDKVKKALARLADIPQDAKKEADTIALLKEEIKNLKGQKVVHDMTVPRSMIDKAVKEAVDKVTKLKDEELFKWQTDWQKQIQNWFKIITQIGESMKLIQETKFEPNKILSYKKETYNDIVPAVFPPIRNLSNESLREIKNPGATISIHEGISMPEQKILNSIAWFNSIGIDPENAAIAFGAGYSVNSSTFANLKSSLRTKGLIEYANGTAYLTNEGTLKAMTPLAPPTREELHAMVMSKLSNPEQRVLQPIINAYPEVVSSESVAEQSGYSINSSTFANLKSKLKTLGLIEYRGQGQLVAKSLLFI